MNFNSTPNKLARLCELMAAACLVAALAACGGGGSEASTGSTSGSTGGSGLPAAGIVPTVGTLAASAPTPTYAAGSDQLLAFNTLQAARQNAGAGLLVQSTQIDTAAGAHSTYLGDNFAQGVSHTETSGLPGYYADTLDARLIKAGYQFALGGEVLAAVNSTTPATGGDCVAQLLNTVYHLSVMLSPLTQVGIGTDATTAAGMPLQVCVLDLATPAANGALQIPATGAVVAYPFPGQTNVPASFQPGGESPRVPVALVPAQVAGPPIAISLANADYVNISDVGTLNATLITFTLTDAAGSLVPAAIIANPAIHGSTNVTVNADTTGDIGTGMAVMIPLAALNTSSTYTVTVNATLQAGGTPLAKTWTFTTAAN